MDGLTHQPGSGLTVTSGASCFDPEEARLYDQFYTDPAIAEHCLGVVEIWFDLSGLRLIEPSAGTGSFLQFMPDGTIAFDTHPKRAGIYRRNFLEVVLSADRKAGFIGNPPFGRCSNMAIAFFNHAAPSARFIAMIFPRTFRKASVQAQLNEWFHLLHDEDLPKDAFLFCGKPYDVPAVFQVWERRPVVRELPIFEIDHQDFVWTDRTRADFCIQRVGADAGRIHYDFGLSNSSTLFVLGKVQARMRQLPLKEIAANTAGNPSICKSEIVRAYSEFTGRPATKGAQPHATAKRRAPQQRRKRR